MKNQTGITVKPTKLTARKVKADFRNIFKVLVKTGVMAALKNPSAFKEFAGLISVFKLSPDASDLAYQLIRNALINASHNLVEENRYNFKTDLQDVEKLYDKKEYVEFLDGIDKVIEGEEMELEYEMLETPRLIPILRPFQRYFEDYLKLFDITENNAKNIVNRLPTYFVFELNDEWRGNYTKYEKLYQNLNAPTAEAARKEREWEAYYSFLEREIAMPVFGESFSLEDIYIPLRAYYEYEADEDGKKIKKSKAVWLNKAMDDWLVSKKSNDVIKVIEGGPGSGKSSFAKWWAARLAKERKTKVLFFPLHHFNILSNIKDAVGNYFNDADYIPINFNPLEDTKEVDQLLLVFDGLDELVMQGKDARQAAASFMIELKQFCDIKNLDKVRIKVLVTGRPIAIQDIQAKLRGTKEQIIYLLPYYYPKKEIEITGQARILEDENNILNIDQRDGWWNKFAALKNLSIQNLPTELKSETMDKITAEPLLNYLVALSWLTAPDKFNNEANINTIYEHLISGVYKRDYDTAKRHSGIADLSEEEFIQILEEIAVCAWQGGDARITTERKIEKYIKEKGLESLLESYKDATKSGVSKLLTAFYFRKFGKEDTDQRDDTFEFTHKSFGEYLLARAIVELIKLTYEELKEIQEKKSGRKNRKKGWTIEDALFEWLKMGGENILDHDINRFIQNEIELRMANGEPIMDWQFELCNLIKHAFFKGMPLQRFVPRKFHKEETRLSRNAQEAMLVSMSSCAKMTNKVVNLFNCKDSLKQPIIWLNQLSTSLANQDLVFKNLNHLNFEYVDFECVNLKRAYLKNSYLEGANLRQANLDEVNLKNSDLRSSNLILANLSNAYLLNADLQNANLFGANLTKIILSFANLKEANLEHSDLTEADLQDSILEGADLKNAVLFAANLQSANLRGANLEGVDLSRANLAGADMRGVNLKGASLRGANLCEVNLANATLCDANLFGVDLEEADLTGADLAGANDITYDQLIVSQSLFQIQGISPEIRKQILAAKPHFL